RLPLLSAVSLRGNPLNDARPEVWRMSNLSYATVDQLGDVPREVLTMEHNCLRPLRSYFDALERGQPVELRDVKVMILGNGQIGKTRLRRRLTQETCRVCKSTFCTCPDSTHGVQVAEAQISMNPAQRAAAAKKGRRKASQPSAHPHDTVAAI